MGARSRQTGPDRARALGADSVGGPVTAAIPLACAAIAVPAGADLRGFFVRNARKEHGLQRWIEGATEPGDRVLVELSPYDLSKGRITYRAR